MKIKVTSNQTFLEWDKAITYLRTRGFNYWKGVPVDMGDGLRHVFTWDYPENNPGDSPSRICRLADLRNACWKVKSEDSIPNIIGYIQVSIAEIEPDEIIPGDFPMEVGITDSETGIL